MKSLTETFGYPFRGDGIYVMLAGAVFFTVADFISAHASILGVLIQVAIAGYLVAYAKDVVRSTAMGEACPPGWTDFSDWMDDLVLPAIEGLVVIAASFGGMIFLIYKSPSPTWTGYGLWLLAGSWGCLTFPIFFLAVAMVDSLTALLNPVALIRAVWLLLPHYLLVCLLCVLIIAAGVGIEKLQEILSRILIVPDLAGWIATIYLVTALMRSFGLLYQRNHETLQWY